MEWFSLPKHKKGHWEDLDSRKRFLLELGEVFGIKRPKDWGKITTTQVVLFSPRNNTLVCRGWRWNSRDYLWESPKSSSSHFSRFSFHLLNLISTQKLDGSENGLYEKGGFREAIGIPRKIVSSL